MKKIRNFVLGGLQQKIFNLVLISILLIMAVSAAAGLYQVRSIQTLMARTAQEQKESISGIASQVMDQTASETLTHNTELESYIVDTLFTDIRGEVSTLSSYAASLYARSDQYEARPVDFPDPSLDGTLHLQLMTEEGVDLEDPAIAEQIGLFGNMEDIMYGIYKSKVSVGSCFIAFPDGVFLIADELPSAKFQNGERVFMPVTDRFWYKGAAEAGDVYFSDLQKDMFTDRTGIVCAAPVYADGELIAVVGTDVFLDALEASAARLSRRRDLLHRIIDATPPKPREILRLRYLEGRTWAQIAEATGYSAQHVQRLAPAAIDAAAASPLAAAFLEARQSGPSS